VSEPVIKGSFASSKAIAQIMTQKFVMGSPLYRQEQELKRQGIPLSRQTMSNWLLRAAEEWLEPLYVVMREILLNRSVFHTDGYEAYHSLGSGITVVGCWAHARRKFDEALKSLPEKEREGSHAFLGKQYIDKLFMLEREWCDLVLM